MESGVSTTGVMLVIFGVVPVLYVEMDEGAVELGDVQYVPDNALNLIVYVVPAVNPATMIGLAVPDASKNEVPLSIEYWYFVNTG